MTNMWNEVRTEYFASKNNAKGIFNSLIEESSLQIIHCLTNIHCIVSAISYSM